MNLKPGQAVVVALGVMVFLACPAATNRAPAPRDFGPYPLDVALEPHPTAQEPMVEWHDPVKRVERARKANAAPRALLAKVVAESEGNSVAVAETLTRKASDPDAAQALMELMRDLAPRGSERQAKEAALTAAPGETKPLIKPLGEPMVPLKPGEPGVVAVARASQVLKARIGTSTQGRFDEMLLQESIQLLGYYGANQVEEGKKQPLADGKGKAAPIHPVVRGVLREFFQGEGLGQAMASRALGQLGDMETAKDLIENPRKYKSASISDFGPEAVRIFKAKQMDTLKKRGSESESEFWQGVRLSYRDRETALDLMQEGHGGAALAVQRHLSMEYADTANNDVRLANYLDILLRFPGTREAFKAVQALGNESGGTEDALRDPAIYPLTLQKMLQIYDHDMAIVFGDKQWSDGDLLHHGVGGPGGYIHMARNHPYEYAKLKSVAEAGKVIFLKYYKKKVNTKERSNTVSGINSDARHLGLPAIKCSYIDAQIQDYKDHSYDRKEWLESECAKICRIKPLWEE